MIIGGLALKKAFTRRYERDEFEQITEELLTILKKDFNRAAMPLFYKNKPSFGDADILVSTEGFAYDIREYITGTFAPTEIFHNGNCWSFDYKELQVDLMTTSELNFDANYIYLSYNDLGNLIGVIAHGMGMKYGQEGLMYDHYFKDKKIGRVYLSRDHKQIYDFLNLSYDRWLEGFDELEDIFEFVSNSKYFNWEYYQLHRLNRINRERNLKRKSYMTFLEWVDTKLSKATHEFKFNEDKEVYLQSAIKTFPEAQITLAIRKLEYEATRQLYINSKFNGGDVMRKYGYKDKDLGNRIDSFKKYVGDFDAFILNTEVDEIYKSFELHMHRYDTLPQYQ